MPRATTCPELSQYERLFSGQLAGAEREGLLEHLQGCDACAMRLHANALAEQVAPVGLIRQGQTLGEDDSRETIARLSKGLPGDNPVANGPNPPPAEPAPAAPVIFACPACGQTLKVKGELAGKKVHCPHCKQAVRAAAKPADAAASGVSAVAASVPPGSGNLTGAGARTRTKSGGQPENTMDQPPTADPAKEVYDFLAPPQAPDELGRLGPYRVLEVLGAGGMGVVFRAEDPQLARLVALKAMLPSLAASVSSRERFLREARAAAAVKHDHIVTIYQVGEDRGVPFLAMEFLDGESLDARLKWAGRGEATAPLPLAEVLRIGQEIALGLAAAHQRGLIHRDIKPANVWLETHGQPGAPATGGRVKILDFGLARAIGDDAHLTQSGAIMGTPAYMAPEQGRGEKVDHRSDLFSLGCVLYQLSTGALPFAGATVMAVLRALELHTPKPVRDLNPDAPPALVELVTKLLAKDPAARPQSAREVFQALQAIGRTAAPGASSLTMSAATPPPLRPAPAAARRQSGPGGGKRRAWGFWRP